MEALGRRSNRRPCGPAFFILPSPGLRGEAPALLIQYNSYARRRNEGGVRVRGGVGLVVGVVVVIILIFPLLRVL